MYKSYLTFTNLGNGERLDIDITNLENYKELESSLEKLPFVEGETNENGTKRIYGKRKFGNMGIHLWGAATKQG